MLIIVLRASHGGFKRWIRVRYGWFLGFSLYFFLDTAFCRAVDNGANTYCHWFQPMASSGVRHGQTGQVQNMMMQFNRKVYYHNKLLDSFPEVEYFLINTFACQDFWDL